MRKFPDSPRIIKRYHPERLTYSFWLQQTQRLEAGTLALLVNSDIYLTDSIQHLIENRRQLAEERRFIALTRYNPAQKGFLLNSNPHWCQDTWGIVSSGENLPKALFQETAFELGQPGCDNKIAYVMHSYGFRLTNPCRLVKTIHLQADAARSYDGKASKLIGLHAFVHPTSTPTTDAHLDFDLLTRSKDDIKNIRVNNWINDRKSYELSLNANPNAIDSPQTRQNRSDRVDAGISRNGQVANAPRNILAKDFKPEEYALFCKYSDRYVVYTKNAELYFFDKYWPTVRVLSILDLDTSAAKPLDPRLFAEGYLPAVLEVDTASISDDMQYPEDFLYWQFPCRTEGAAYEVHRGISDRDFSSGVVNTYLPLPWATFIDKKKFPLAHINLLSSRISSAKRVLANFSFSLNVHTVCQHIRWTSLQPWTDKLGVTDLWISHKELGVERLGASSLHPWTLYAVNYMDKSRSSGLVFKPVSEKRLLASFIGAHMEHYPSDIRLKLGFLQGLPDYTIEIKKLWHFNKIVYDYQVFGEEKGRDSIDEKEVVRYNEVIADSVFSLCPAGAGPNTLRLWESLSIGAIPVVLSDKYEMPKTSIPGLDWDQVILRIPEAEANLLPEKLKSISDDVRNSMQKNCIRVFKNLVHQTCF